MSAEHPWRRVTGTKSKLPDRISALRVRVADELIFGDSRHLPGAEVWLADEWRSSGARKYDLSNLPARITRRALVGAIKACWIGERAHQQLKEGRGLDRVGGCSWTRLHRHALMIV